MERHLVARVFRYGGCNLANRRIDMRDGTNTAGAFLRSELYRDASRDVGDRAGAAGEDASLARGSSSHGAGASLQRTRSGAASPSTALALLGLLDPLAG